MGTATRLYRQLRSRKLSAFRGSRWERIQQAERKAYQINAYRVLLTRTRQGMVIIVPHGASDRQPEFYDDRYA